MHISLVNQRRLYFPLPSFFVSACTPSCFFFILRHTLVYRTQQPHTATDDQVPSVHGTSAFGQSMVVQPLLARQVTPTVAILCSNGM